MTTRASKALTGAALLCAALMVVPPLALGNPGAPGLDRASSAVYSRAGDQSPNARSLDKGEVGGEVKGGPTGPSNTNTAVGDDDTAGGSSSSELPFTGLAAGLVLALGLIALLIGSVLRVATRQPERA